jgi:hypothetical protein
MNKTIYISVPMTGRTYRQINNDIGRAAEYIAEHYDYDSTILLIPTDIEQAVKAHFCWSGVFENFDEYKEYANRSDFTYGIYIGFDIMALIDDADTVLLCPGWEQSKGCRLEKAAAEIYGKEVVMMVNEKTTN